MGPLAKQGYATAQNNLGVMYKRGQGVARDYAVARGWFERAAKQGFAMSQNNLGVMYDEGQGGMKDAIYAYMWASIAASNGYQPAEKFKSTLGLSPSQLQKAQKLARECVQKNYRGCSKEMALIILTPPGKLQV